MEIYVYADLLFLVNAGMDGLCMILTGRLLHRRLSPWRILAASVLGGGYAVLSLLRDVSAPIALLLDVGVCLLMCAMAFIGRQTGGVRRYFLSVLVYFLLSMALGGVMTALYTLWNRLGVEALLPQGQEGLGTWLFALLAMLGGVITLWGGRMFRRIEAVKECTVTVFLGGQAYTLCGIVDSGNLLRDPFGGRAVICVSAERLLTDLPPDTAEALRHPEGVVGSSASLPHGIRFIPAATATGGGLMTGFLPERVILGYAVRGSQREREVDTVIALANGLTHTEALVPSELIE